MNKENEFSGLLTEAEVMAIIKPMTVAELEAEFGILSEAQFLIEMEKLRVAP